MNKEYKIVQGNYKTEDDVVIQIDTTETITNVTSSTLHVGTVKKQIEIIDSKIASLVDEKTKLQSLLDSTSTLAKSAIKKDIKSNE